MNKSAISLLCLMAPQMTGCGSDHHQSVSDNGKPNVILFIIDDFGYGDISFEGNTQIRTPNIDRIAEGGARFTRFYQSSAASAPTRASLLTGRYHLETGVWDVHNGRDFIHRDETTIADALKTAGYTTGAFGKWHSGKTWSYFSWNRGFDIGIHPVLYKYLDSRLIFNNKLVNTDGPVEDVLGDEVVRFIGQNTKKPFFAYLPIQSVHEPFNCPADLFQKYKQRNYSDHVARLYGMIELVDKNIGKILDAIKEEGLEEKTMIMFMSDDGPSPGFDLSYSNRRMNEIETAERTRAWNRVLRGGKASIYEGGSISPFYIMWKDKIEAGKKFSHLSGVIDIYPTILEACGVKLPENNLPVAGKSLWPLLQGREPQDWDERCYFDNTNFYRIPRESINISHPRVREISVHHRNFKLIRTDRFHYGKDTVEYELYDLDSDPFEKEDVAAKYPELLSKLKLSIDNWFTGIIAGGRSYRQAVYETGNWEERGTPVNLDAYVELGGTVRKNGQSDTRFNGWTTPGSLMVFNIDIVETGDYRVELFYDFKPDNPPAEYLIFTEYDTARLLIAQEYSSMSEMLRLPRGPQQLTIQLAEPGGKAEANGTLNRMIVHRIPGKDEPGVLRNLSFTLEADGKKSEHFTSGNDVADFMFKGGTRDELFRIPKTGKIKILPSADNPEDIAAIEVFKDFQKVAETRHFPFEAELPANRSDKFTLNVEFISKKGVRNSVRAYLTIE